MKPNDFKIAQIMAVKRQAIKEAQKAVDKIFDKHSKTIVRLIAAQLPKGHTLNSWNGRCNIESEDRTEVVIGNWFSRYDNGNPKMEKLSSLQYGTSNDEICGVFDIPQTIKSINL